MFEENIPYPNLKIRKMTTRWGVCNRKNNNVKRRMTQEDKFKINNIDKINKRHGIKKDKNVVGSFGSISLPEIEDDIKYQKIDG